MRPDVPRHLRHRPTWHGLAVPYINCWGDEVDDGRWRLLPDANLQRELAWWTAAWPEGQGRPTLGRQNLQRQREVVARTLCQVCAHQIGQRPRWFVIGADSTQNVANLEGAEGQRVALITEPWVCARCLPYVIAVCPGVRRMRDEGGALLRATEWQVVGTKSWHEAYGRQIVAWSWIKVAPVKGELIEFADFTKVLNG